MLKTLNTGAFVEVRGVLLRADPARSPALTIVHDQLEMPHFEVGSPERDREMLHSSVNEEIQSLEIAAESIAEFPDASWELRLELARQCWDETRHAALFRRRLLAHGGWIGEFPIINQEWGVVCSFETLAARVAVQNRVFEAGSLDVLREAIDSWRYHGDLQTAEVIDAVLADEVGHVEFANRWLAGLRIQDPRALLQAVAAMSRLRTISEALTPPEHKIQAMEMDHDIAVNTEDRRHAGFAV